MPTVILARHGRTTANATGVLAGRSAGVHLDATGIAQAKAAAARLTGLELAAVVTSPLARCRETARLLVPGVTPRGDAGLTECDYGSWSGRPLAELTQEAEWAQVQSHPAGVTFPGGESMAKMSARAVNAMRDWDRRIGDSHGNDAVWLAVSHGDIIKAIIADALGMHLDAFQRLVIDPASLSVIRYQSSRPFVLAVNTVAGDLGMLQATKPGAANEDAAVGGGIGALQATD